jgi:putative transmembrane protein
MIDAISGPLWTANQASGKVKNYMIVVSLMVLSNIPFAYILLKNGFSPIWVMALRAMINFLIMLFRVLYLRHTIQFPAKDFIIKVVGKALLCIFIVGVVAIFLANTITEDSVFNQLIIFIMLVLISLTAGYFVLLVPIERKFVVEKISSILGKICRKK